MTGRAAAVRLVAVLLAVGVAFAIAEIGVRLAGAMPRYEMRGIVLELDPDVLFRLVGASDGEVRADGYRDRAFPPDPAGARRVLVVGDSFVMGYNVPVDATLPRALGRVLGDRFEVRNQGIYGYGPDQSLLRLRDEGLTLRPEAVVLVLFPANDFRDLLKNGLVDVGVEGLHWRRSNPVREALPWSRVLGLLRERATGSRLSPDTEEELFVRLFADAFDLRLAGDDPEVRWKTAAMQGVLAEFRDLLAARGVELLVVVVPSWEGMTDPGWFEERGIPSEARFAHEDRTVALCGALGIPVLDLRDVLRDPDLATAAYDPEDHHFSVLGNDLAARAVASRLLAPVGETPDAP